MIQLLSLYDNGSLKNHNKVLKPLVAASWMGPKTLFLGQLQFKEEAAGKVRVFAMVDSWTQSLLAPLHRELSNILRQLPNDGTFDQNAAFKRAVVKSKAAKCCFGYDLSAATDRLPIDLQVSVLSSLFGEILANSWKSILVEREYVVHMNAYIPETALKYAVGQPMGALSSFNMLALTHHLLLQRCAMLAGATYPGKWYENYEILGDDIVIFDPLVAQQYLITCHQIGMEINVKKSVVAYNSDIVEFAKRTSMHGLDVSAIPWKLMFQMGSRAGRLSLFTFIQQKGYFKRSIPLFNLCVKPFHWSKTHEEALSALALIATFIAKKEI
jgi:hypothetical protein